MSSTPLVSDSTPRRRCEAQLDGCTGYAQHRHHRRQKATGGAEDNSWPNIAEICFACHHRIHHDILWAMLKGWIIESWQRIEDAPDPRVFEYTPLVGEWYRLLNEEQDRVAALIDRTFIYGDEDPW